MAGVTLAGIGYMGRALGSRSGKKIGAVMAGRALTGDTGHGVVHNGPHERGKGLVALVALRSGWYMVCRFGQPLRCLARCMAV